MRYCIYQEVLCTVIYIDELIFTNILINYFILSAVKKFLHIDTRHYRLILAGIISAVCSLVVFLPIFETPLSMMIKLLVCTLAVSIAFGFRNIKVYIKTIVCMFVFSVIFCGIMILFYQGLKPSNMAIINDIVYFQVSPVLMIAVTLVIYLIVLVITRLINADEIKTIVNISMKICGKDYSCIGKIDTGNSVVEPFSQAPVIIVEKSVTKNDEIKTNRIVPYKTISSSGILGAVKADGILIDGNRIDKEVYIGVYDGVIDNEIKAIINSDIIR